MGVKVLDLKRGLAEVDVPVGDEVIHLAYRPGMVTPGFSERCWFRPAEWVAQVVERWDVERDDGAPLPLRDAADASAPSAELRDLPTDLLLLVQRSINQDLLPGKRFRATSAAG